MIRVTIDLIPFSAPDRVVTLGKIEIANDATGDRETGNYEVTLFKMPPIAKREGVWKKGKVTGFDRVRRGPYDLLLRALIATIGNRNNTGEKE